MNVKRVIFVFVKRIPYIKKLHERLNDLELKNNAIKHESRQLKTFIKKNEVLNYPWFVPPGHFYSPLVAEDTRLVFGAEGKTKPVMMPGINLKETYQLKLLRELHPFLKSFPFNQNHEEFRYKTKNDQFGATDATGLFAITKYFKPKTFVEVGSGWSSALMLDINDTLDKKIKLTFIEPYPERLYSTFRSNDKKLCKVIEKPVQSVNLNTFTSLGKNDVLFIDNSHVSKSGSDVNFLLFEVLPRLKPGVIVHIHDIFYPFEYPKTWIKQRRNWNEIFAVRAFLTNNDSYEILFWENYLDATHNKVVLRSIKKHAGFGASIWLRKVK